MLRRPTFFITLLLAYFFLSSNTWSRTLSENDYQDYSKHLEKKIEELTPFSFGMDIPASQLDQFFINTLFREVSQLLELCQELRNTHDQTECFRYYFRRLNRYSFQAKVIDQVTYRLMRAMINRSYFNNNNFITVRQRPILQRYSLTGYLLTKKQVQNLRKAPLSQEVSQLANRYYNRRIRGLGQISIEEYLPLHYSRIQLVNMGSLLNQTINMMSTSVGYVHLFLKDDEEDYKLRIYRQELNDLVNRIHFSFRDDEIREFDQRIKVLSKKISQLEQDSYFQDLKRQLTQLQSQESLVIRQISKAKEKEQRQRYYQEIRELQQGVRAIEREIAQYRKDVPLSHHDIYKFSISYLEYNLKVEQTRGYLKGKNVSLGDVVMAAYMTGILDQEILLSLLQMDVLQEGWEPGWKKAGRIAISATRTLLVLTPLTSVYASLAFIIYDSIKNVESLRRNNADEAHLL